MPPEDLLESAWTWSSPSLTSSSQKIIDEQNRLSRGHSVLLDLYLCLEEQKGGGVRCSRGLVLSPGLYLSVLQLVGHGQGGPGKFALLPDLNEAHPQPLSKQRSEEETPGVQTCKGRDHRGRGG